MKPEVVNKNRNCVFNGPYAGRDLYITMYQDSEREFVVTHNVNIKPVAYFTGRETELQELRQRIEEGRKSVLVSGMGGIGKTHICRKLFEEYLKKHAENENCPFQHIGYIEYSGDMGSSLQNCLKFKQQDNPEQNQEAAWKELEYLASDGKLLLFVDNVDKTISADPGLQRLKGIPGAVVLTSRQTSFGDEFEPYRIRFLDMEQCKEIYEKIRFEGSERKTDPEDAEDLEYIIENLAGRHTITVELLAHLARTKPWSVKRLREELEEKGFRLTFHKNGELVNIQESYEKLYDLSELTEAEQNILEAFSVIPYIPLAVEICNEWLLADTGANEADDILTGLYQKGWLQFDVVQESFALHPVFAQFICKKCKPNVEKHVWMMKLFESDAENLINYNALELPFLVLISESIAEKMDMRNYEGLSDFVSKFIFLLLYLGKCEKAEQWCKNILEILEEKLEEYSQCKARIYWELALVYEYKGDFPNAKIFYIKSRTIYEKNLGINHPETALIYLGLAGIYTHEKRYEKAEELYRKSIRIYERDRGVSHS